jgi:transposase
LLWQSGLTLNTDNMKQLIEDYKRRLATIEGMIENFKSNGSEHDNRKDERFKTKASEFRTIIAELEREDKLVICLTKEEVQTFMDDACGTGAWSDTSYKILEFIGLDPREGT